MRISRLETFVKLAELNSFSLVAEELELTQPAVSIQVKNLEEYFGVQLVERGSDGVFLTAEGKLLYRDAREIIRVWKNIEHKINQLQDIVKGELTIGASTIPAEYILPQMIVEFCNTYPLVEVKMEVNDSEAIINDLLKKRCDLGIVGSKPDKTELLSIPIASDRLVLIVPRDHPLAAQGIVTKRDLLRQRFIMREEGSGTRKAMGDGLNQIGISLQDLQIAAQMGSTEAVIAAVEAGLGISVISSLAVRRAEKIGLIKVADIEGFQVQRQFYLAYSKDLYDQNLVRRFVDSLK